MLWCCDVDNWANVAKEIRKNKGVTEAELEDFKEKPEKEMNNTREK